jgi:chromosome segregation ATPase
MVQGVESFSEGVMQDSEKKNQSLDEDILQCKADLLEALKAMGRPAPERPIPAQTTEKELPVSAPESTKEDSSDTDDIEAALDAMLLPDAADEAAGQSHNPQKENITEPSEEPSVQPQTTYREDNQQPIARNNLPQDYEHLKKELQQKNHILMQQKQRLEFLETQLQHAVILERTKSRFQQEALSLDVKNRELTEEIAALKKRKENTPENDAQVQQLQNELDSAKTSLTQQQTLLRLSQETTKTLKEELASLKQTTRNASANDIQKERQLAHIKSEHDRMRREYEQFRGQKEEELSRIAGELENLKARYRQLNDAAEQTRHEYEAFQTQANGEIHSLTESRDLLQNENKTLTADLSRLKEEHRALNQTLKDLKAEWLRLNDALGSERESGRTLGREKDELTQRLQVFESTERRLREEIEQLRESVVSAQTIREELAAAQTEINRLNGQNQLLQEQLTDLRQAAAEAVEVESESVASPTDFAVEEESFEERYTIPAFNLADQIMEAHRRSIAGRRQRVQPAAIKPQARSVRDVIRQYIPAPVPEAAPVETPAPAPRHQWFDQSLTPFQQEILQEIIRTDMELYSRNNLAVTQYSAMNN